LQAFQLRVDAGDIALIQNVQDPVPDVIQGEEVSVDRGLVARRGVGRELREPEIEASEINLDWRSVT
jgi:hypothetical protein